MEPEALIWIFGAARTGSTWLSRVMSELDGQEVRNEPLVGALFGNLYYDRARHLKDNDLRPEQVRVIERIAAPLLEGFYSVPAGGARR